MELDKIRTTVAENLRRLMNKKHVSNATLARKCKISTGTISKVLQANMSLSIPLAVTLANGLEVNINELLAGLSDITVSENAVKQATIHPAEQYTIGIISIANKRYTCIKNLNNEEIGTSELQGNLDLIETSTVLMQLIQESINTALANNKINLQHAHVNLALQSYEFEDTRVKFSYFAKKYFKDVNLFPDSIITYLATFQNDDGIALIADKEIALSFKQNGVIKKLGGWKFPVYDFGGENWLGIKAIHHTIEAFEGYVPMTNLAKNILAKFNGKITKVAELCSKATKNPNIYCLFAETLLHSYFTGDKTAQNIVTEGSQYINRAIEKIDVMLNKKTKIAISGSLADIYKKYLDEVRLIKSPSNAEKARFLADVNFENVIAASM
jgi:glucosamine kinase